MDAPELIPGPPFNLPIGLADGEAHLWSGSLHDDAATAGSQALLSVAEQGQANRFRFDNDRRRYTQARAALRRLLAAYTRLAPEALHLEVHAEGKPWLVQDPSLHFNLSHAGDALLIGVTRRAPIGVDIEVVRSLPGGPGIAWSCFSAAEQRYLANCPTADHDAAFLRVWTAKEATVKALGTGLSTPLPSFSVRPAAATDRPVYLSGLAGDWTLLLANPQPGYQAAIAVRANQVRVRHGRLGSS